MNWPRSSSSMAEMVEERSGPGWVAELQTISPLLARSKAVSCPSRVETTSRFVLGWGVRRAFLGGHRERSISSLIVMYYVCITLLENLHRKYI